MQNDICYLQVKKKEVLPEQLGSNSCLLTAVIYACFSNTETFIFQVREVSFLSDCHFIDTAMILKEVR